MRTYKNKSILIIGAGMLQVPAIKIAAEKGLTTIVTDYNKDAPGMAIADFPLVVSTRDIEGTVRVIKDFNQKHKIDGVLTVGTDASMTVAAVANALNLPGIKFENAEAASNKVKMRERLKSNGVPIPDFRKCWNEDDLRKAAKELGYPLVIKPADNMGARGVMKIENELMLETAFQNAKKGSPSGNLIVEQYMKGPELSIDALIYDGEIYITGVADRIIEREPYFIEIGHVMPSALPEDKLNNAIEVFKAGIKALGLTIGAAKGDIKVTDEGAKIGEIAARLSGGFMSAYTYPLSSGVNLIANAIDIALGNPPENLVPTKNWVSIEKTILPAPGIIKDIVGVDKALAIDGVKELFLHVKVGDEIAAPKSNVEKPLNYIIVRETREDAWKTVEEVEKVLAIVTDDKRKISFQEINKKAKEKFAGMCNVCPDCNGEACKGLIPGMGGIGNGAAFIRNCRDIKNIIIHTRMIHPVKEPDASCDFLGTKLQLPLLIAPITGCDINMGNQITELEYDEELVFGAKNGGIMAFVGDGAQPYLYKTGLRAIQKAAGHVGAIFKPRRNQQDIITRLKEASNCGAKIVGIDIDAAAFITMKMTGQEVSTKTVDELKELVDAADVPFCVKGIMSVGDALCAVDAGVKYLIVSNHGGRITQNQPSSISMLPEIRKAVGNKVKLILDGGIRSGEDIFKALALGADYCMTGRPFAISVLGGGRDAVKLLIEKYTAELQKIMLLTGAATIQDITADMVSAAFYKY